MMGNTNPRIVFHLVIWTHETCSTFSHEDQLLFTYPPFLFLISDSQSFSVFLSFEVMFAITLRANFWRWVHPVSPKVFSQGEDLETANVDSTFLAFHRVTPLSRPLNTLFIYCLRNAGSIFCFIGKTEFRIYRNISSPAIPSCNPTSRELHSVYGLKSTLPTHTPTVLHPVNMHLRGSGMVRIKGPMSPQKTLPNISMSQCYILRHNARKAGVSACNGA